MANYSLIVDSTFRPFSYQELMAPVARMSDVHSAIAEQYDKLSSQADVLEAMGANDRDKDSGTYERYKNYSNALRAEAEQKKDLMTLDEFLAKQKELEDAKEKKRRQKFIIVGSRERVNASAVDGGVFVAGNKVYKWGDTKVLDQ